MLRIQYMLTTARRSLKNPLLLVTIVSLNHAMASCVVGVWLCCNSVIPTTVRGNATPDADPKADASSRLSLKTVGVPRVVVERVYAYGLLRCGVGGETS